MSTLARHGTGGDGAAAASSKKPGAAAGSKADAGAWLAVAAGTVGALMATLDVSIVNAALPTIQGEIGASGSEGTWVSTAYLVAEIVMIPLAGWLQKTLGLRSFLLIATSVFTLCSIGCGLATTLPQMIAGRVGQGFSGGALIPTALTIVATRLPPAQRPIGTALFGVTAILGPVVGPVVGGWLTEHISWHYTFFINLPIGAGLLTLVTVGLPAQKMNVSEFRHADLLGIAGLVFGLGALTTLLEEGQRELWFESPLIVGLAIVSAVGFVLLLLGQRMARQPVIRLRILLDRQFAGVFVMSLVVGAGLYGLLFLIPQFLSGVAGYNAEQSGFIAALGGLLSLLLMPTFPLLVSRLDVRIAVATGLLVFGISAMLNADLTAQSSGSDFVAGQLLRGVGMFLSMVFLNQAATAAVGPDHAEDASGLFNAARNLGGSFGLAAIATLLEQRTNLHYTRIAEAMPANSLRVQQALHTMGAERLASEIKRQATAFAFSDLFWLYGLVLMAAIPLVLLMRPLPQSKASTPSKQPKQPKPSGEGGAA